MRLSLVLAPIVNPRVLAKKGYGTDPAALAELGSGPFKISDFSPGTFVEFVPFEDFFQPAYVERMRFENFDDDAAKGLALRGGQLDVGTNLASADVEAFAADGGYELIVAKPPSNVHQMFMFASPRPELQDARVREAVILATNRQAYVDAFFPDGTAKLATQPILAAPGVQGYNPALQARPYDPERAKALLADAGVKGLTLKIIGWPSGVTPLDEAITDDLAKVGITAKFTKTDQATFLAEMYKGYDYGITDLPNAGDMFDALQIFFPPGSEKVQGDPRSTPAAVKALAKVNGATGEEARSEAIRELMKLEHDEMMLGVPIAVAAVVAVARRASNVRDFRVSPGQVDSQNKAWIAT
jgi:ABC-type transport system substrate-binding protein